MDLLTKLIRTHNREPAKLIQFPGDPYPEDFLALGTHYNSFALMTCIYSNWNNFVTYDLDGDL